jgi:hypothetical protein
MLRARVARFVTDDPRANLELYGLQAPELQVGLANGTNDVNWVKVNVDAERREVFSFQTKVVPANRVAVPAP